MKKRRVGIFTGNRAEYGLQMPIINAINQHPNLDYELIVSGAHLDSNFGSTLNEIQKDGFKVSKEIKIEMNESNLLATNYFIGKAIIEISNALVEIKPDIFVVYADRFEGFAAVIASSQLNIPTAHIEGGDLTEGGALDDSLRHAMTKLSHLHFTTNTQATNRILGMGEEAWRVHTVGFPAIDLINQGNYANPEEVCDELKLNLNKPIILFTQHSVTTEFDIAKEQLQPSLNALTRLAKEGNQIIVTYPNNDAGGKKIIESLNKFSNNSLPNIKIISSLGRYMYHGLLSLAKDPRIKIVCAGNSSSGIKETPAFTCPSVNIGSRQAGRLRGSNVLDCRYSEIEIYEAIMKGLHDNNFRKICANGHNPYWQGGAGSKIAKILSEVNLSPKFTQKKMTLKGSQENGWFQ